MRTISKAFDPERLRKRMDALMIDNLGIVKRPGADKIEREVLPMMRKYYRTTTLPPELNLLEAHFLEKVLYPRSRYSYEVLRDSTKSYDETAGKNATYTKGPELLKQFSFQWRPSTLFKFNPDTPRAKRALKHAAGLPTFGTKKEALQGVIQYNERVVKPSPKLARCYSVLPGYRTQQSPLDKPKVRLVWSIPAHIWHLESEALSSCIDNTIAAWHDELDISLFYTDPAHIHEWFKECDSTTCWWATDAKQFDSTVQSCELAHAWHYLAGGYEYVDLLADYSAKSDIVMPSGIFSRDGGMPSGSLITNIGDGLVNIIDALEVLDRMKLLRYLSKILVNGDDMSLGFSTKLTEDNLKTYQKYTRRVIEPDKSALTHQSMINSKWYFDFDMYTRPIFRAINSLMFKEAESDPLTGSREYVAIARAQIMKDIEMHPYFDYFAGLMRKIEKYSWAEIEGSPRFKESVDKYVDSHDYLATSTSDEFVSSLRKSRYIAES